MNKKITNTGLLKKILGAFLTHLDENGNGWNELENFHNKIEWITTEDTFSSFKREPKYIENKPLKELSKIMVKEFQNIRLVDIYNVIPGIFWKIDYFFRCKKSESGKNNINIDYRYILGGYINFIPKSTIPDSFQNYENYLDFFEEVILKTLDHMDKLYSNFEFSYEWKIPFEHIPTTIDLDIDNRVFLKTEGGNLIIRGIYKEGYILDKFHKAFRDLYLVLNIFELEEVLKIDNSEIGFGRESFNIGYQPIKKENFTFSNTISHPLGNKIIYFQEHIENFISSKFLSFNTQYLYLLSDKLQNKNLFTASHFFGTESMRFESQIFLSRWQAIEIMLGSPEKDIKNQLKSSFVLFFPKQEENFEKIWQERCKIVHEGKVHLEEGNLELVKNISKELFLKMILINI